MQISYQLEAPVLKVQSQLCPVAICKSGWCRNPTSWTFLCSRWKASDILQPFAGQAGAEILPAGGSCSQSGKPAISHSFARQAVAEIPPAGGFCAQGGKPAISYSHLQVRLVQKSYQLEAPGLKVGSQRYLSHWQARLVQKSYQLVSSHFKFSRRSLGTFHRTTRFTAKSKTMMGRSTSKGSQLS